MKNREFKGEFKASSRFPKASAEMQRYEFAISLMNLLAPLDRFTKILGDIKPSADSTYRMPNSTRIQSWEAMPAAPAPRPRLPGVVPSPISGAPSSTAREGDSLHDHRVNHQRENGDVVERARHHAADKAADADGDREQPVGGRTPPGGTMPATAARMVDS